MEEVSQPEEEEWGSYWEVTKEPGRCNARASATFRGQGRVYRAWTRGLWHTGLSAGGAEDRVSLFPSEPRPQNQTLEQESKQSGAEDSPGVIKTYFWTTKKEGKLVKSVIVRMRRSNSLSCSVSVSSRGRCSLDRKELEPHARKYASEKVR